MGSNLSLMAVGPDASGADGQPSPRRFLGLRAAAAPQPEQEAAPLDCGQRLVIQEVGDTGDFVYTVIDRASGQVVGQTPRQDVARMSQNAAYAAGSLIKARA